VLEAESGPAALKVWDQHGSEIDLLLTDMVMPEGMTGTEIAQKLKERRPDLKTVFTSGYIADFVGKNYVLSEELNFIQKPFLPDRLARTIRNCLDHQGE
jgi:DNA-binding NtrC family response regulator